ILTSEYLRARDDGMSDADLLAAVRDAGLSIAEGSNYHGWLGSRGQPSEAEELGIRVASICEATGLMCTPGKAPVGDLGAAAAEVAAVCDRAARLGVRCFVEFYPWTSLGDFGTAWEIVRRADRSNGGIMFDTWHHYRSGGTANDLRRVPRDVIAGLQLSDAPSTPLDPDLLTETRQRLMPGDRDADVAGTL